MGSQDQHRKPDLYGAIAADLDAKQKAHDDRTAPERESREARIKADAALYGTPAWESLPLARRDMVAAWSARQNQGGGTDAA